MAWARRSVRTWIAVAALAVLGLAVPLAFAQEPVPIFGTDADDVLTGTPGKDTIYGRGGNDVLIGLDDDDELDGGPGADLFGGGPGRDAVSYAGSAPVVVTLDGQANDGAPGEGDNVRLDIEDVYGSAGADKLTGDARENILDGDAGDDQITGGPGSDGLFGGEGDDQIDSRDGSTDRVECGSGNDVAFVDARDTVVECEKTGRVAFTENFQVGGIPRFARRATRLKLGNIVSGSRVTVACVRRCRPRSPRTRIVVRRRVVSSGAVRAVQIRIRRSPLVAGATFEVGVRARRARPRCRRFRLASKNGAIVRLIALKARCTSVARNG